MVIMAGGFSVGAFTAIGYLAPERAVNPDPADMGFVVLIMLFFMLGLAPLFEWWFRLWRNVDRWCNQTTQQNRQEAQ